MAEKEETEESKSWWDKITLDNVISAGKGAGEIYKSFLGDESSEETAYLKGQVDALNKQAEEKAAADTLKIGDFEISTSSVLWIIGGSLGLLAVAAMFNKVVR